MIKTNKSYAIVIIEGENNEIIFHGKSENVTHVLNNSEYVSIIEVKYFNNVAEFDQTLQTVLNDFTNDSILEDATIYNCDSFITENNIDISIKTVSLYDYNKEVYNLLTKWFHAEDRTHHKLNKDYKGYYIVTGLNLFNPNKLYLTEQDAIENHYKQYLQMQLNELTNNINNWILKEVITEEEFRSRCLFLDRLNNASKSTIKEII
ncbi:hypothetical protein EVU96_09185 [Bacillus infantis]|uniref:hypothetical protein n=1 Tax=Bacillus infantis TaxID=324767 RepID=UPI00101D1FB3|nr:hypothetical protein [Bacillus infantis]RYI30578.1 hypothetical protein EVU96_09185 [Bacillus infantis]